MKRLISASFGALVALGLIWWTAQRGEPVGPSQSHPAPSQARPQTPSRVNSVPPGAGPKRSAVAVHRKAFEHAAKPQPRKRPWDKALLGSLKRPSIGDRIRFELIADAVADGTIHFIQRVGSEVIYISGELSQPEKGRFFFQKQTRKGLA